MRNGNIPYRLATIAKDQSRFDHDMTCQMSNKVVEKISFLATKNGNTKGHRVNLKFNLNVEIIKHHRSKRLPEYHLYI